MMRRPAAAGSLSMARSGRRLRGRWGNSIVMERPALSGWMVCELATMRADGLLSVVENETKLSISISSSMLKVDRELV